MILSNDFSILDHCLQSKQKRRLEIHRRSLILLWLYSQANQICSGNLLLWQQKWKLPLCTSDWRDKRLLVHIRCMESTVLLHTVSKLTFSYENWTNKILSILTLTLIVAGFFGSYLARQGGGWNPPFLKHRSVVPTIFILQQQSASYMKGVMFSRDLPIADYNRPIPIVFDLPTSVSVAYSWGLLNRPSSTLEIIMILLYLSGLL